MDAFDIGRIYLPKVADSQVPSTKTYEDVLTAIDKRVEGEPGQGWYGLIQSEELSAGFWRPIVIRTAALTAIPSW